MSGPAYRDLQLWDDGPCPRTWAVPLVAETRDQWLAIRRTGVTASQLASVAGIPGAYGSPFSTWHQKKGNWEIDQTLSMRIGLLLEPIIAQLAAESAPWLGSLRRPDAPIYAHPLHWWLMATPDFLARVQLPEHGETPIVVPVECKSDEGGEGWGADGTDEIPGRHLIQVWTQCAVLGSPLGVVARLAAKRLTVHPIRFDDQSEEWRELVNIGASFMKLLETNTPPDVDDTVSTSETLRKLFPPHNVDENDIAFVPANLADAYESVRARLAAVRAEARAVDSQLRIAMRDATEAHAIDGRKICKRTITERKGYVVKPTTIDTLRPIGEKP